MIILFNSTTKSNVEEPGGKQFDWIVSDLPNGKIRKLQHHGKMDIFHVCSS